jgi:hypothetical protein
MGGAPVLGGRNLKMKRDNQPKDGVGGGEGFGEAIRTGGTHGGGRLPIVLGGELRDEKRENTREGNGASDFDGCVEWQDTTTNRKSTASLEYIWARRRAGRRRFGRTLSHLFGLWIKGQKKKKNEIRHGFRGPPIDNTTQQPTR